MIGVAHHSPAILTVLIDRTRYRTHNVAKADPETPSKVKKFLDQPDDGRQRVLFVEEIQALSTLAKSDLDLSAVKMVVFDGADKLTKVDGLMIVDAQLKDNTVWQMSKLMPEVFNGALEEDKPGGTISTEAIDADPLMDPKEKKRLKKMAKERAAAAAGQPVEPTAEDEEDEDNEDEIEQLLAKEAKLDEDEEGEKKDEKAKPSEEASEKTEDKPAESDKPKKNWVPKANQLSGMLTDVLSQIDDKETRIDLRRATLEYAAGLRSKKNFSASRKSAVKAGADDEAIGEIQTDLESAFGEKIYSAYYDMSMYSTSAEKAAKEAGIDVNELNLLTTYVPPSEENTFCWPAPVGLDEKRKK